MKMQQTAMFIRQLSRLIQSRTFDTTEQPEDNGMRRFAALRGP